MTSTIANTTNITVVSVFLLTTHPLTRRRPSGQHSIKAGTPRRISRPWSVATMRLLVGHAPCDHPQNVVSALDATIGARMVGNFGNVAPLAAQEFLEVLQGEGPYRPVLVSHTPPNTPEVSEHAHAYPTPVLRVPLKPGRLALVVYGDVEDVRHSDRLAHMLLLVVVGLPLSLQNLNLILSVVVALHLSGYTFQPG